MQVVTKYQLAIDRHNKIVYLSVIRNEGYTDIIISLKDRKVIRRVTRNKDGDQ